MLAEQPLTYPDEIEYLVMWAHELHGRSGAHMSGLLPLSPVVLEAWARLSGNAPLHPEEVEGLYRLDAAMFYTEDEPAGKDKVTLPEAPKPRRKWPTRKA